MTPDTIFAYLRHSFERCVCNRVITTEPYFGMELPEQDAQDGEPTIVYFDASHEACLREWDLALDFDNEIGLAHVHPMTERIERYVAFGPWEETL